MQRLAPGFILLASAISAVSLAPTAASAAAAGPLHAGCWVVVDPDAVASLDNAEEVLCVDASGHAAIRESSFYGEGVKGCNIVAISSQGGKFVVDVNFKRCTNDAPSHKMTCEATAASGAFACVENMGDKSGEGTSVKLAPLPAGQ